MKNGKCPKCNSMQVFKNVGGCGQRSYISPRVFKGFRLIDYICAECGFTESYVSKKDDLDWIKNNLVKI